MSDTHEHDLGLAHDLRVMSRRRAFRFFGAAGAAAAGAAVLAGCADGETTSSATSSSAAASTTTSGALAAAPQETAGPYPGDGSNGPNVLIESGVVRQDITTSFGSYSGTAQGVPVTVELTLTDLVKNAAGADMAVYLWHCDRDGKYSLYGSGIENQNYLRGVQVADANGKVSFTSIFPACYDGRWPHIHFEVYDSLSAAVAGSNARLTSQIALPQDVCEQVYAYDSNYKASVSNLSTVSLSSDNVFGDGWDAELARVTGTPATGLKISIPIGVGEASSGFGGGTPPAGGTPPGGAPGGRPPSRPSGIPSPPR